MSIKIRVNADAEHVATIRRALVENDGYCPCALVRSEDTKCMCREFRETAEGMCHCGLYVKEREGSDE